MPQRSRDAGDLYREGKNCIAGERSKMTEQEEKLLALRAVSVA